MRTAKYLSLLSKYSSLLSTGIALSVSLLSIAPAHAVAYTEVGDAGDLPTTAQAVSGQPNATPLTFINGTLTSRSGITEGDMFKIYISSPSTFSATTNFGLGVNSFDTQLFLFTLGGIGILANDDDPNGGSLSTIPAGTFAGLAGYYELLITGSSRYPVSSGGLIFPNFEDADGDDPTGLYGPSGPGGASPVTGYTGNSNDGGSYSIRLTGAQFGPADVAAPVPEPSTIVVFVTGFALLVLARRRRAAFPFPNASVSSL